MKKLPRLEVLDEMAKTGKGFTRSVLAGWGVSWPPKSGWCKELRREILEKAGTEIISQPSAKKAKSSRKKSKGGSSKSTPKRFAPSPNNKQTFYASWEWKKARMVALERDGHRCCSCGASPKDGIRIVVDHIKPLGKFWNLRLDTDNLQVLCDDCNRGKGDWLHADFREVDEWVEESDPLMAEFRAIIGRE